MTDYSNENFVQIPFKFMNFSEMGRSVQVTRRYK